jgi:hypothetical protein
MRSKIGKLGFAVLVILSFLASVHYTVNRIWVFEAPAARSGDSEIQKQAGRVFGKLEEEPKKQAPPKETVVLLPAGSDREHGESFAEAAKKFPWAELASRAASEEQKAAAFSKLIFELSHFSVKEPLVPIDESCRVPPELPNPSSIDCMRYPEAFSGKRSSPAKIAHMVQFGFDVDVLEIHLRELYDIVDKFFILESTRAHKKLVEKPLMWERIKDQERFLIFHDKIVHIILDDVDSEQPDSDRMRGEDIWYLETTQEGSRFARFLEWNKKHGNLFGDDDMIGFGDTDEVSWRTNIHLLKHCVPRNSATDIGIWFPMGRVDHAFRTDWPVPGHPYSLGDPTFYTIRGAKARMDAGNPPSRNRGKSGYYLLGGMHMTRHRYLPFLLLESLTCSECGHWDSRAVREYEQLLTGDDIRKAERFFDKLHTDPFSSRVVPIDQIGPEKDVLHKIPWFLACNRKRYPYWWGEHDTRLD